MNPKDNTLSTLIQVVDTLKTEVSTLKTQVNTLLNTTYTLPPTIPPAQPSTRPSPKPYPKVGPIYLPELDYLLWITQLRDEFREGQKSGGKMAYAPKANTKSTDKPKIIYGYLIADIDTTPRQIVCTIPAASVRQDLTFQYGMRYQDDFRYAGTQAVYARGVYDRNTGGEISGTASCAIFNKTTSFKVKDLIQNTKQHWHAQTDEQKRMRIVDEEEMDRILDKLEDGTHLPGQGTWCMEEPRNLMAKETDDTYWLSPRKVRLL